MIILLVGRRTKMLASANGGWNSSQDQTIETGEHCRTWENMLIKNSLFNNCFKLL